MKASANMRLNYSRRRLSVVQIMEARGLQVVEFMDQIWIITALKRSWQTEVIIHRFRRSLKKTRTDLGIYRYSLRFMKTTQLFQLFLRRISTKQIQLHSNLVSYNNLCRLIICQRWNTMITKRWLNLKIWWCLWINPQKKTMKLKTWISPYNL